MTWLQSGFRVLGAVLLAVSGMATAAPGPGAALCDRAFSAWDGERGPGVMLVLSPRMPYALREWPRMRDAARNAGFDVSARRDPRVTLAEWRSAVVAAGVPALADIPALEEREARALGVLHHAPSSLVVRAGRVHPWPILGVMPDAPWVALLRDRARQLEHLPCA